MHRALGVVALALLASCALPVPVPRARGDRDYEKKAVNTAEAVLSAVSTAHLAATASLHGKAFGAYLDAVVTDAEDDAEGAAATFLAIQSPSERSDGTRRDLDGILGEATSALADLRTAVRRGDSGAIRTVVTTLGASRTRLEGFEKEHG